MPTGPAEPADEPTAPPKPAISSAQEIAAGPPTVETFFGDLLTEVSQRTGYPEEMLDPELPLESGLGIDSIKVMEIFSALKPYHQILADPDQDDEEVLAQFVELKSLGAIREHYARRRAEILESDAGSPAAESPADTADAAAAPPNVQADASAGVAGSVAIAEPTGNGKPVDRLVVRSVRSEPLTDCELGPDALRFSKKHVLLLVGDAHEYGPRHASLAGAAVSRSHHGAKGGFHVRIRHQNHVVLCPTGGLNTFPVGCGGLVDVLRDRGGTDDGHGGNLLVAQKRIDSGLAPVDETDDAVGRLIERQIFFIGSVRCMIGGDGIDRIIGQCLPNGALIRYRAQRRIHLRI